MQSSTFWKAVLVDRDNLLDSFLEFMRGSGARYRLIEGAGINAYTYPVVTVDLDIVVAAEHIETMERSLSRTRRPSKQLKDLSDIARILEVAPALRVRVPPEILERIPKQAE